ncbi:MAG: helix-turn-helix domain-containing protein [Lachnospiraceae bacterium]|nr:helix-turn-helix domain-containing protein [Robinsoniella sp.]MDY3765490.1 helix-turn-helix domain-containing protein [Lachnospiraceae bacterium]
MGYRLLIVDDEIPAVQGVLDLRDWREVGITEIDTAYSMREAIEKLETHPADILLTDIEMPGGTGLDLISWVKNHAYPCVSVILSSYPNFEFAQRAITLGVFEYLLKPIDDEKLENVLCSAILKKKQQNQESKEKEEKKKEDPLITSVKKYIYDHISEEILRDDIADYVNLSPAYLSTFFKRETGGTISDFIKNERIHFAKKLLRKTNLTISTIAQNVGYDSLAYFSSVFRSIVGCTPREYRARP